MTGPKNLLPLGMLVLIAIFFMFDSPVVKASDIYIAQNSAGSVNGTDCADAYAVNWFNTGSNWGTNSGQIGPGTTVHLCGTFNASAGSSGYLTFQSSGQNGNPITLLFEPGAVLTSTYWSGGVININGESYVVVNGGTNGLIQATANGTNQANQQDNGACVIGHGGGNATNVTIENLTCSNLYIDASPADNGGEDTYGIDVWNTSNLVEQNNTLHDMKWAIRVSYQTGQTFSNLTVTGNNIYDMDHGVFIGDSSSSGSAVMSGFYIYGNTLGSMTNWDNTADNNHHDGFHLNTNSSTTQFTKFYLYNNYLNGDIGANANGGFFSYPTGVNTESDLYVFNNLFVNTSANHCWANGFVSLYGVGATTVVNNTFVSSASACKDNGLDYNDNSTGLTFENNIVQNTANSAIYLTAGVNVSTLDYNNYFDSSAWFASGDWYSTLASWQSGSGYDTHSTAGNPGLSGTFHLTANPASAWQSGQNLYSTCDGQPNPGLGALCSDKAGVARQSTGSWDMGAYEDSVNGTGTGSGSGSSVPAAPAGLAAVVQ